MTDYTDLKAALADVRTAYEKAGLHGENGAQIMADALAAIEELEARNQWQPIETAPHDTEILVLMEGEIYQASLYTKGNGPNEWIFPMAKHHGYWCRSGDDDKPTHWMPLPQPPETPNDRKE